MNKAKRIAAIVGVVLICSMYLIALISAFVATEKAPGLFLASIFSTIVIPIMLWFYIKLYEWMHKKNETEDSEQINAKTPPIKKN